MASSSVNNDVLASILAELRDLKVSHQALEARLSGLDNDSKSPNNNNSHNASQGLARPISISSNGHPSPALNGLSSPPHGNGAASPTLQFGSPNSPLPSGLSALQQQHGGSGNSINTLSSALGGGNRKMSTNDSSIKQDFINWARSTPPLKERDSNNGSEKQIYTSRAVLTTYPGQVGVNPIPVKWGATTAQERGPILASRQKASLGLRNAIGAYNGSYSIYHALSVAIGALDPNQRPNYFNTEPVFDVKPNPSWFDPSKIVTIDPWGHLAQVEHKQRIDSGIDIRPTISITKAHLKIAELDDAVRKGRLSVDGKIVIPSQAATVAESITAENGDKLDKSAKNVLEKVIDDAGVEVNVSKVAFENVWYLPGVAERLKVSENLLRRALFEDTGGMYPELLTRQDLKVFLPPIAGSTAYIFGPTTFLSDPTKKLAVRVHDACGGSDVFGSDICTCRPYLLHGIEEAIKCAQEGGVGLVVYFNKEGRALGEVTKYLVYNARKRGGDNASQYFARTEGIAGVKDARFQALMPDVLHWLGVQKIDDMYSMSDMKHDAVVNSGIPIYRRHDLPAELIPPDSQVEIQAKINAGYFSSKGQVTAEDLTKTVGRAWEDLEH
ncbi:hypothetical protein P389DRAFT_186626 [Cystobasidium minutum MCA 4210]|uniref:uncharacterized protein n=1 Tax=Cystobasidium minutum MCA 4210 TaxID=1397322 RepID=UPI0034CD07F3|eukprot:jgi/Rhomi1/186626/estExt_fgenesh1_pm.C_80061